MRYDKIFNEVREFTTKKMPLIVKNIIKTEKEFEDYTSIIKPFNFKQKYEELKKNWVSIAIDGGMGEVNLQGIGFVIATAQTYSVSSLDLSKIDETTDVKLITLPPTAENTIIGTLLMKALEYFVAWNKIKQVCELDTTKENSKLILFDGSLSYPDRAMGKYGSGVELNNAFKEFESQFEKFLQTCLQLQKKNHKIFVASIAKDPRNPKYLRALSKNMKKTDPKKADVLVKNLEKHKKQERKLMYIMSRAYNNMNMDKKDAYPIYTDIMEVNKSLKLGLPGIYFQTHDLFSIYYQLRKDTTPFYIEIPEFCSSSFIEGMYILNYLSEISPQEGYPLPLVYVDVLARVSKNTASQIFQHLKKQFITQHPKYAYYVIADQFREELHR